jgi:hypothetical protein
MQKNLAVRHSGTTAGCLYQLNRIATLLYMLVTRICAGARIVSDLAVPAVLAGQVRH